MEGSVRDITWRTPHISSALSPGAEMILHLRCVNSPFQHQASITIASHSETVDQGDFILIAEIFVRCFTNRRVNAIAFLFSLCYIVKKHMTISLHPKVFCIQGHSLCDLTVMTAELAMLIKLKILFFCQHGDMSKSDDC